MSDTILSRVEAKKAGLPTYFTGVACKNGHINYRYTVSGTCADCAKDQNRKHFATHREKHNQRSRDYYTANLAKERRRIAAWIKENPALVNLYSAARRARYKACTPQWLTPSQRQQMLDAYAFARAWTLATGVKHDVDHIIPLRGKQVSGLHVPWNLRIIPAHENRKKSNRLQT
jgi:hypothetical protein